MGIGGGLVVLGLVLFAAAWVGHEPFWDLGFGFGEFRDPPRWASIITGAKKRLVLATVIVQLWAVALATVGMLILFGAIPGESTRAAVYLVIVGGALLVAMSTGGIIVAGRIRAKRRAQGNSNH